MNKSYEIVNHQQKFMTWTLIDRMQCNTMRSSKGSTFNKYKQSHLLNAMTNCHFKEHTDWMKRLKQYIAGRSFDSAGSLNFFPLCVLVRMLTILVIIIGDTILHIYSLTQSASSSLLFKFKYLVVKNNYLLLPAREVRKR